jgi:dihydrofolate reductase
LNTKPKYVASTTLTDPKWADTTVLSGDLAAAVGELKAKPAGQLQVHGSGALIRWLLNNDLVDEINLLIVPVVVGQATRLFPDTGPDLAHDLVESRADSKGVTVQVYRPAGRPQYATPPPCLVQRMGHSDEEPAGDGGVDDAGRPSQLAERDRRER